MLSLTYSVGWIRIGHDESAAARGGAAGVGRGSSTQPRCPPRGGPYVYIVSQASHTKIFQNGIDNPSPTCYTDFGGRSCGKSCWTIVKKRAGTK